MGNFEADRQIFADTGQALGAAAVGLDQRIAGMAAQGMSNDPATMGSLAAAQESMAAAQTQLAAATQSMGKHREGREYADSGYAAGTAYLLTEQPANDPKSRSGQMTERGSHEVLKPYDTEVATLMQGFGVGPCPICNRGAEDHTFTADEFNHAHAWCVYADGEATGLVAGQVIEHGPHEVLEACRTPWYHNPSDPRHRPGRVCACKGTGWERVCTTCHSVNCDGVHDYCLNCDGEGRETCPACEGEGARWRQVTKNCPDCDGGTVADCRTCDGEGELSDEAEVACSPCKGTGDVTCTVCNGTGESQS